MMQFFINTSDSITSDTPIFVGSQKSVQCEAPSYKLVYKPHEYYSYKYHKTIDIGVMFTNLAIELGPHIV